MSTYITKRPVGLTRDIVVRTEESRQRASHRAMLKTPTFDPKKGPVRSAQDVADETHLSRSKPYFEKGKREAERRVRQMNRRLGIPEQYPQADAHLLRDYFAAA
jgi:hypothetical protein